ncbi:hypothetical protein FACS1894142_2720 [Spirochaetia bacterium]|nr:hypothetical protein FACS1894142_2720 [Spirochaetia bacterium]
MANDFKHIQRFKKTYETKCIKLLVSAYKRALVLKSIKFDWMEDDITAQLNEYITSDPENIWHIDAITQYPLPNNNQKVRGYADHFAVIDMRFFKYSNNVGYEYFAEAKNLKEHDSYLKRRYIDTGIDNFICGKYNNGCLLAYILEGDLMGTIGGINKLLEKDKRNDECLAKSTYKYFDRCFESMHPGVGVLKHLAFDFT